MEDHRPEPVVAAAEPLLALTAAPVEVDEDDDEAEAA